MSVQGTSPTRLLLTVIFKLWNHAVDLSFILDKLLQHMGVRQEVTEGEAERSSHGTRENLPPSCSPILPQPHAATWPPAFMVSTVASRNVALQPRGHRYSSWAAFHLTSVHYLAPRGSQQNPRRDLDLRGW